MAPAKKRPRRAPAPLGVQLAHPAVPAATAGAGSSEAVPDAQNTAVEATCLWCKKSRVVSTLSRACRACAAANNVVAPPRDERWTPNPEQKGLVESMFSDHPTASAAALLGICDSRTKELLQLAAFAGVLPKKLEAFVRRRRNLFTRTREARLSRPGTSRTSLLALAAPPSPLCACAGGGQRVRVLQPPARGLRLQAPLFEGRGGVHHDPRRILLGSGAG